MNSKIEQHLLRFKPEYNTPGFWLAKLSDAGEVLLSPDKIQALNAQIDNNTIAKANPLDLERLSKDEIRRHVLKAGSLPNQIYSEGLAISSEAKRQLTTTQNLRSIHTYAGNLYGLTIRRTNMRAYPTKSVITESRNDLEFDLLQHLALEPGTPLALLHASADDEWYFCLAPYYYGWVNRKDIAESPNKSDIQSYHENRRYVVVTESWLELPIYGETLLLQMGSKIPYMHKTDTKLVLRVPTATTEGKLDWQMTNLQDYIGKVSFGHLPCRTDVILQQAFKMIDEPYAWGGARQGLAGRDCSRFIQDIFRTVGIFLPRDTTQQCDALTNHIELDNLSCIDSQKILKQIEPHNVVLCMPGHIMLYIGQDEGQPFAIHALWAYSCGNENSAVDEIVVVNKVLVTSLNIGSGSQKGTFLERLSSINKVRL